MNNSKIVIVNSDDFGISDSVNAAIVRAFQNGSISSTTLMASMPGFGDAVEKANTIPELKNCIGLHLNLTEGVPLTDDIKTRPFFCENGVFSYQRKEPVFFLSGDDKRAVYKEVSAQLKRLIDNNVMPTHLDGHHHVHTEFGIVNVYLAIAKEHGINKVRISKNAGKTSAIKSIYKTIFNTYVRSRHSMITTDIFCSANEYAEIINTPVVANKNIEVMVHAMLNDKNEVVDIDKVNLEQKMRPLLQNTAIQSFYYLK